MYIYVCVCVCVCIKEKCSISFRNTNILEIFELFRGEI